MKRRIIVVALVLGVGGIALVMWMRHDSGNRHFTGFVEGEERVLRSEVSGRVLEVRYEEGDEVPAGAVVARLDERDIEARLHSKREELSVLEAEIAAQEERVRLAGGTWKRDVQVAAAEVWRAQAAAGLAAKNLSRERELVETGASTAQSLDEAEAAHDEAQGALRRAGEMLARARAQEHGVTLTSKELESLERRRGLLAAQVEEVQVVRSKYEIRAPDAVATVVQTRFVWPGELARPGTAVLSVIDPLDKYVQIYVPVPDLETIRVGDRVEIELDSRPGVRVPGEISFIADRATFTPEKIETRSDRVGQVYRAKVRILERPEAFRPGTEGNVYLVSSSTNAKSDVAGRTP